MIVNMIAVTLIFSQLTVDSHSEDKEWHGVELTPPSNTESEALHSSLELNSEVLVVFRQMTVHLLILLTQENTQIKQGSL